MSLKDDSFDKLLAWLDSNKDLAMEKYENIRHSLIKFFILRGCSNAEELVDTTVNRVANNVETLEENYVGDPTYYFYGVARYVYREYLRLHP